ncbi:conserved hypothetical protein [Mesorhizobium sp. ORS 3324]|nr:conserved hypothetical protein [Mesorhizobium sp. ORS 3324]
MALDITAQDIIIDETTGLQDDDINPAVAPYNTNTTLTYLLTLGTSIEVAFQSDFVVASASAGETINSIILTQNASGTPFSTTVGVNSGIKTVDGNYVWLFQDPTHPNVVIGVIGTSDASAAPAANGPLAFSFGLDSTSATHADLYLVQYVPLLNPDTTNPDDRIDLTDKVFASVSGTTTVGFSGANAAPGNHDFYIINSPDDASKQVLVTAFVGTTNATANVSTQGFGIANQSIDPTETLQIDFVTGGTLAAGTGSQIQYGSHLDNITQAGFTINQITPSNPNLRVDITIKAFDNTGNEKGSDFFDGTTTNAVDITSIKLTGQSGFASIITTDGDYATGSGTVHVSGLSGTGNAVTITGLDNVTTVDITTASQMDRLTITGVDSNEGCDVTEVHFTSSTPNAYTEQVGSFINFDDDGPSISTTGTEPTLTVDETVLTTNDTQGFAANFSSSFGADGAGQLTYALGITGTASGLVDTATNEAVVLSVTAGGVVEGRTSGTHDLVFTVSVDGSGNVTLDQIRAVVHSNTANDDDSTSLAADNLIQLTATVTDKDGDHKSATLDIGQNLNFKDDGPHISTSGTEPTLTVDETVLATNDTQSFAGAFTSGFGADGAGTLTYALGFTAGSTGLVDTATGEAVVLSLNGSVIEGHTSGTNDLVFTVSVDASGNVTLDQIRAVVHSNTANDDDSTSLAADNLIQLTATITDKDGDHHSATLDIGQNLNFKDDGPHISTTGTAPTLTVDETVLATNATQSFAANFSSGYGADGAGTLTYTLGFTAGSTGLVDTLTGQAVVLSLNGSVIEGHTSGTNDLVFTVSVDASGNVTLDQIRAVVHPTSDPDESTTLAAANLIQLTATITDKDGDHHSATLDIGQNLVFKDDGPTITVPFDGDQDATNGTGTHETLANAANASATGAFGYDIGADAHPAAFYDATHSDFVDQNTGLAGVQIGLTGTIVGGGGGNLLTSDVTLASESATSAAFNFSFTYDADPAAGVQTGTAGGTLVFDKVNDTYTITLTDPLEGFSFDVLHTAELLSKQPTSNTGHPKIVVETLQNDDPATPAHDGFYVQFTGNSINKANPFSLTLDGEGKSNDTSFTTGIGHHELVSNNNETWVSATQSTNGVAGDTIQSGELLTLRFFNSNVGIATEFTDPTATASAVAMKFDGIGNSEDLMLILDLTDGTNEITRAIYVPNSAIFKTGQVPAPYNTEFTLDNNDGLVVIEQNDYNTGSEHYVIQGIQIMQSGNGITGTAISLNGTTGSGGASTTTTNFDPVDTDVLKITDIGFTSTVTTTPDAHLDFGVSVADADGDATAMQHILVDIA